MILKHESKLMENIFMLNVWKGAENVNFSVREQQDNLKAHQSFSVQTSQEQ